MLRVSVRSFWYLPSEIKRACHPCTKLMYQVIVPEAGHEINPDNFKNIGKAHINLIVFFSNRCVKEMESCHFVQFKRSNARYFIK